MELEPLLHDLCSLSAPSGAEQPVADYLIDQLRALGAHDVHTDVLGSVHALFPCGKAGAKKLLLDAHIDQIGLIVTAVEAGGFVRFAEVGGIDQRILPDALVTIHTEGGPLDGIIAVKPPHISKEEEQKKALAVKDLVIDTGLADASERVHPGDFVTLPACAQALSGCYTGPALDDRAGCAAVLLALSKLAGQQRGYDLLFLASSQEEVGARGAKTGGFAEAPDAVVVVDVGHGKCAKTQEESRAFPLGGGPVIGFGPNLHRPFSLALCELAQENHLPHHREAMGGDSGTNAWVLQVLREGVRCALVSIPLRYMHTPVEVVSPDDIRAAADLVCAFANRMGGTL